MRTDWTQVAKIIRDDMKNEQPPVKIRKVMRLFGLASTSTAEYYLHKLEEKGEVKRVDGKWYLV